MSKKAITLYAGLFGLGLAAGTISYLDYQSGDKAVEAAVAGTNAIPLHIGLAVALVVGIIAINYRLRQDRAKGQTSGIISGEGGFWKAPFTDTGWHRLLFALLGLPLGLAEFCCSIFGAKDTASKLEQWRMKRYLAITPKANLSTSYYAVGLIVGVVQTIAALMAIFTVWRAGLQVIGAFDPNFGINAWGGPTYLGASGAHWMDAFIIFYVCICIVRAGSAWQGAFAVRSSR